MACLRQSTLPAAKRPLIHPIQPQSAPRATSLRMKLRRSRGYCAPGAGRRWSRQNEQNFTESRKGISEIEGKAARAAVSESGSRTSFNQQNGILKNSVY